MMVVSYIDDGTGAPLGTIIFFSKILSLLSHGAIYAAINKPTLQGGIEKHTITYIHS